MFVTTKLVFHAEATRVEIANQREVLRRSSFMEVVPVKLTLPCARCLCCVFMEHGEMGAFARFALATGQDCDAAAHS